MTTFGELKVGDEFCCPMADNKFIRYKKIYPSPVDDETMEDNPLQVNAYYCGTKFGFKCTTYVFVSDNCPVERVTE